MTWPPKSPANTASLEEAAANTADNRLFWRKQIRAAVFDVLRNQDDFSSNDITMGDLPEIHGNSLIGIEIREIAREGFMKAVGVTTSTHKSRRGGIVRIYEITDKGREKVRGAGVGAGGESTEQKEGRPHFLSSTTSPDPGVSSPHTQSPTEGETTASVGDTPLDDTDLDKAA